MVREIPKPANIKKIEKKGFEFWVLYNDDILLSQCRNKPPRYGAITTFGIEWNSFEDLKKDHEETCHEFFHLVVFNANGKIIAPSHADEIYNMRIHPYINQKLE